MYKHQNDLPGDAASLPEHLISLPGETWAVWKTVGLRSAGFPASTMLKLAPSACVTAANSVATRLAAREQWRTTAKTAINQALDTLQANGDWSNQGKRKPLLQLLSKLNKEKFLVSNADLPPAVQDAIRRLQEADRQYQIAQKQYQQQFQQARAEVTATIQALSTDDRFCEAIIWQNLRAYKTAVKKLQSKTAVTYDSQHRRREELIANYAQRYCLKNDTIGFFGPVGWATWKKNQTQFVALPGDSLLRSREVYFEQWGIDTLAKRVNNNHIFRKWQPPCRLPYIYIEQEQLYLPTEELISLSTQQAHLLKTCLQWCDGLRSAEAVASILAADPTLPFNTAEEIYELLHDFEASGLIRWQFEPPFLPHPDKEFRILLETINEPALQEMALSPLVELEKAREHIQEAAGQPEQLAAALQNLEACFTKWTDQAPTRFAGKTYAARTLVYEDSQRNIEVELGSTLLHALAPPLTLLLQSAQWLTFELGHRYRQAFQDIYERLAGQHQSGHVSMVHFWHQAQMVLFSPNNKIPTAVQALFQAKWQKILNIPWHKPYQHYHVQDLQSLVATAFAAPKAGWAAACYHSPDVMISSPSAAAIQQGIFDLVMGELHVGTNTLGVSFFVEQHPDPATLFDALASDVGQPRIIPISPKRWPEVTARTRSVFNLAKDFQLAFTSDAHYLPDARVLPIGDLVVIQENDQLWVQTRDKQWQFDIIEVFAESLSLKVVNLFQIATSRSHVPRLALDRLIIQRETWRFHGNDLLFAQVPDESQRFLQTYQWWQSQGLPRFVFVKVSVETKPFFVDFHSPLLISNLAKVVRRLQAQTENTGAVVTFTEMLPHFGNLWLPDADDQRYTSELRIVAVDRSQEDKA